MISLSYGQVPDFDEFEQQFYASPDVPHTGMYCIILSESDARMHEECGLYAARMYDCESLYAFVDSLSAVADGHHSHGEPWSEQQMDWAGSFASSIMFTLGYDWV